jgi:hypothetical protein
MNKQFIRGHNIFFVERLNMTSVSYCEVTGKHKLLRT